jgi:hypothetical protein
MTPAERKLRARLGGYAARVHHTGDELLREANRAYRDSFRDGHRCAVCPDVRMAAGLTAEEVVRRAEALRRAHYTRLAMLSARARSSRRRSS